MTFVIIQVNVNDYSHWRSTFDSFSERRKEIGSQKELILQNLDSENAITLLIEWATLDQAKTFGENPKLIDAMCAAGATEPPIIKVLKLTS